MDEYRNIFLDDGRNTEEDDVKALNRYTTGKVHKVVKWDTRVGEGITSGNQHGTTSIHR